MAVAVLVLIDLEGSEVVREELGPVPPDPDRLVHVGDSSPRARRAVLSTMSARARGAITSRVEVPRRIGGGPAARLVADVALLPLLVPFGLYSSSTSPPPLRR